MSKTITDILDHYNLTYTTDQIGNIYCTKGNADLYPTMVAHIDTVHDINDNVVIQTIGTKYYAFDKVKMQQYGIGGDDKVGIFITIMCLLHYDNFKAAFFVDEEVGCVGSSAADHTFFNDSTIVLQCDRRGDTDFVTKISNVVLCNDDLLNVIRPILKHYERTEVNGGLTDVKSIAMNNDVQVANMSCGYYNPHSDYEYIDMWDVYDTLAMCKEIFDATSHKRFTITDRIEAYSYSFTPNTYYNFYKYNTHWQKPSNTTPNNNLINNDFDDELDNSNENIQTESTCKLCDGTTHLDPYLDDYYCYDCQAYDYETIKYIS
jgi:hypothetical protein